MIVCEPIVLSRVALPEAALAIAGWQPPPQMGLETARTSYHLQHAVSPPIQANWNNPAPVGVKIGPSWPVPHRFPRVRRVGFKPGFGVKRTERWAVKRESAGGSCCSKGLI